MAVLLAPARAAALAAVEADLATGNIWAATERLAPALGLDWAETYRLLAELQDQGLLISERYEMRPAGEYGQTAMTCWRPLEPEQLSLLEEPEQLSLLEELR